MPSLDDRIAALAARDRPLAEQILKEAIRIPADYVDRPVEEGGDPDCGLSNHEGPRLEYLRRTVVEVGAVRRPEDVDFDDYGNLVWTVEDPSGRDPRRREARHLPGRPRRHGAGPALAVAREAGRGRRLRRPRGR